MVNLYLNTVKFGVSFYVWERGGGENLRIIWHDSDPIVFFILLTFLVKGNKIMLREQIFVI